MDDVGSLVVSGGDRPEALEGVNGSFDFVPAGRAGLVEAGGSAAAASTALAVGPLVPAFGDRVPDLPSPQVSAVVASMPWLLVCVDDAGEGA